MKNNTNEIMVVNWIRIESDGINDKMKSDIIDHGVIHFEVKGKQVALIRASVLMRERGYAIHGIHLNPGEELHYKLHGTNLPASSLRISITAFTPFIPFEPPTAQGGTA